jgi:hypothetical protein
MPKVAPIKPNGNTAMSGLPGGINCRKAKCGCSSILQAALT